MERLSTKDRGSFLASALAAGKWSMDAGEATTRRIVEGNAQVAKGLRR